MVKNNDIQYENKVVAFLDILGFSRLVFQSKDRAINAIKQLDKALSHSLECLSLENGPKWFSAKLFSDCICISCHVHDLLTMLSELAWLQFNLSTWGIFVHGAIAEGAHFENARMIFSEGLINAYELNKRNKYPRVLIKETIVNKILEEPIDLDRAPLSPWPGRQALRPYLIMAPDGLYFLDYLQYLGEKFEIRGEVDDMFRGHKNAILEQVHANIDNHSIVEKYKWLAEYHNFKFNEFYDLDGYVEVYFKELSEKMVIPLSVFPSFNKGEGKFAKLCYRK